MKIKFTFRYCEYKDSKFATFLSIVKGSVGGFFAWIGLFLIPLLIGCGIASQYSAAGTVAIIIGIIAIVSYGCLFLIDESDIGLNNTSSPSTPILESPPDKPIEKIKHTTISELRLDQITKALTFANIYIQKLTISDDFIFTRKIIVECLNNDLLVYEMVFNAELYNENNSKAKAILDQQGIKAVAIALDIILDLSNEFSKMRKGELYGEISKIVYKDIQYGSIIPLSMNKQELKDYFIESIKASILNNGGNINGLI